MYVELSKISPQFNAKSVISVENITHIEELSVCSFDERQHEPEFEETMR